MQLKSLEIHGFKSFPDKVRMEFADGITAVVGPNGSGKSNIVDAFRWVFGEQSTKTLRGAKMDDVIFGGTKARREMGFATVCVTIDNSDRQLDFDSDEIAVSRRLSKSGDSDYRINGAAVRLKDVHELFMDTGLGRDGYSIIGQGKIAEIISAKSSQRREIFEEAAGISKYRYRKGEAERRLDAVEENLLRLRDILIELEGRVGPLEKESAKAKEFLSFSGEKKVLEISLWLKSLKDFKEKLREVEDKYIVAKSGYEKTDEQIAGLEAEIAEIYGLMQQCSVLAEQKREEIKTAADQTAEFAAQVAVAQNDMMHNGTALAKLEQELQNAVLNTNLTTQKIAETQTELAAKTDELEKLAEKQAAARQKLEEQQTGSGELRRQDEQLRQNRGVIYEKLGEVRQKTASVGTLLEETASRLGSAAEENSLKEENISTLQRELANCKELLEAVQEAGAGLANSKNGYTMRLASQKSKLLEVEEKHRQIVQKMNTASDRAKLLEDMEKNMEGYGPSVKYVLAQATAGAIVGVEGTISQLIAVDDTHATAVETALGGAMQNIVVKDEYTAKKAIELLAKSKNGRATFLPLTAIKGNLLNEKSLENHSGFVGIASSLVKADAKYLNIVLWLLGRVVVAKDMDSAVEIAKAHSYRFRVVTLDGQVVNTGGSMTGGYTARTAGILGRKGEIAKLRLQASELEQEAAKVYEKGAEAQKDVSATEAEIWAIEAEIKKISEDEINAAGELKVLENLLASAVAAQAQAIKDAENLAARLNQLENESAKESDYLKALEAELAICEAELEQLAQKRALGDSLYRAAEQELSENEFAMLSLKKDIEVTQTALANLAELEKGEESGRAQMLAEIAEIKEKNTAAQHSIENAKGQSELLKQKTEILNEEIAKLLKEREQHEQNTTKIRQQVKELGAGKELMSRDVARLEERKTAMQLDYDNIIARLWDEYELTRSAAEEIATEIEDRPKAERRLQELKNKIRALGSVNVGAIEEYKELNERYTFLKTQTDDVEKSRNELLKLIEELTGQMKEIFVSSFAEINRNFSAIFKELFGGGHGHLELTDQSNVLESGIEIFAQPPGKIIKNLATLSGGEQTFVAIAIYFAILKVNPSPFCLLDEIEAALDDVNVVKFAQYLNHMAEKTQFIAITHRRGTMEEADNLYGVTMEEEGVSKLLALKVTEIEERLGIKNT